MPTTRQTLRHLPPNTVVVGPLTYQLALETLGDDQGVSDTSALTITIDDGLAHDRMVDTVVHEAIHAIVDAVGQPFADEATEERFVSAFAPYVVDMLRRTPGLVEFIVA